MHNRSIISYGKIAESELKFLELITIFATLKKKPALTEDVGAFTPRGKNHFGNLTKPSTSVRKCELFHCCKVGQ